MTTSQGPSSVPTSWRTVKPISVAWMSYILGIPKHIPRGWTKQFQYFGDHVRRVRNLKGDFGECGLGEGNTLAMMAYYIGMENGQPPRTLWGFDSFKGWPRPTIWDASPRNPQEGDWIVTREMVTRRLEESGLKSGFPGLDIQIIEGFLNETLPDFVKEYKGPGFVFLHLDLDLYPGYHDALMHLWPLVLPGGIVAFDEFREFHPELPGGYVVDGHPVPKWPGCDKAVREFFAGRQEELRAPSKDNPEERGFECNVPGFWYDEPTGKYFVIRK